MTALTFRRGGVSLRVERQTLVLAAVMVVLIVGLMVLGLCYGASWMSPARVFDALSGGRGGVYVREWRLPRVVATAVFGMALGAAGAIFQNVTRNPLGAPDVIGLDAGAYTGALFAFTVLSGTAVQLATGSIIGGLVVAGIVYALSLGGGLSGFRLIVIGIALNAMINAINSWIILRVSLDVAIAATGWNQGSLNGLSWGKIQFPIVIIVALLALLALRSYTMHQDSLGAALSVTTGVNARRLRLHLVLLGVGLTATVTAVCGPIAFIALSAPQIGRRLARAPGIPLLPAAFTGAVLLLASDLVAQILLAPVSLPVGVVTTAVGGCYLIWLLSKEVRRR
ncbi:iron-enterobactin ABC transporter permease [Pseudonocardiaceae bacterium YIM PH 21723]|nr:iron-enterobactin ABC transporter permease [Pseudonocardiaceae bacterium YIM PH 21723]